MLASSLRRPSPPRYSRLARPTGIVILVPFAAYYLIEVAGIGRGRFGLSRVQPGPAPSAADASLPWAKRLLAPRGLLVLSPLLGVAAYLTYMYFATGNPLEISEATKMNVSGFSLTAFLHPATLVGQLLQGPLQIHGFTDSMIDRACFAAFLALLIPLFRRMHVALSLYALAAGTITIVSGSFVSYSRYVLLAFPPFIVLTILLSRPRVSFLWTPLLYLLVMVQSLFLVMHSLNYWLA